MIIDELVARLGFQVEGVERLRKASAELRRIKSEAGTSVKPLGTMAGAATKAGVAVDGMAAAVSLRGRPSLQLLRARADALKAPLDKAGDAAKRAAPAIERVGTVSRIASAAGLLARGALVLLAGAALTAVGAFVGLAVGAVVMGRIAIKAIQARREMQLLAQTIGTTAANIDILASGFATLLGGTGAAKQLAQRLTTGASALLGKARGPDADVDTQALLKKYGLKANQPNGAPVDAAQLAAQIAGLIIDQNARLAGKRKEADDALADRKPGSKARASKARKAADGIEADRDALTKAFGITPDDLALLKSFKSSAALKQAISAGSARDPGLTLDQDADYAAKAARLNEVMGKLSQDFSAIGTAITNLAVKFSGPILSALESFEGAISGIVKFLQNKGLIAKTVDQKANDDNNKQVFGEYPNDPAASAGAYAGRQISPQKAAAGAMAPKSPFYLPMAATAQPADRNPPVTTSAGTFDLSDLLSGLSNIAKLFTTATAQVDPSKAAGKVTQAAGDKTTNITDAGNDQRVFHNSVTVNAPGPTPAEIAATVKSTMSASNLSVLSSAKVPNP